MKVLALWLCALGVLLVQMREGNFDIRFEPTAVLQTGAEIPFRITVKDALHKPLPNAQVTLQIEAKDGTDVKVFPAPAVNPGIYVAKPVFPRSGDWNIYVEVQRGNEMSARTIQFQVSK